MSSHQRRWSAVLLVALCALIVLLLVLLGAFTDETVTETVIANEPFVHGAIISIEGSPSAVEKRRRVRTLEGWTETGRFTSFDGSWCRIEMVLVPFSGPLFP